MSADREHRVLVGLALLAIALWLHLWRVSAPLATWPEPQAIVMLSLFLAHLACGQSQLARYRGSLAWRGPVGVAWCSWTCWETRGLLPGPWNHQFWMCLVFGISILVAVNLLRWLPMPRSAQSDRSSSRQLSIAQLGLLVTAFAVLFALPHYIGVPARIVLTTWGFFAVPLTLVLGLHLLDTYQRLAWALPVVILAGVCQAMLATAWTPHTADRIGMVSLVLMVGLGVVGSLGLDAWSQCLRQTRPTADDSSVEPELRQASGIQSVRGV